MLHLRGEFANGEEKNAGYINTKTRNILKSRVSVIPIGVDLFVSL